MNKKFSTLFFLSILCLSLIAINIPFVYAAGTRFYLPSAGAAAVSPAYQAAWENSSQAGARLRCVVGKTVSAMASITTNEVSATNNYDMLSRQYVSDQIAAQTISGTVFGQIRTSEANIAANADPAIIIYVVNSTGTEVRGTLLSYFPAAQTNEYALTTLTNRMFPASKALSSVTAQDGDRIVIEIGTRMINTIVTSYNILLSFGDNSATDLAVDNTTTTANCPYIEFSQFLIFYNTPDYNGGWTAGNATGWINGNATGWISGNTTGWISGNASGWISGNDTGWISGNTTGWLSGNTTGWNDGNATGYTNGWNAGNATGWIAGNSTGYSVGWNAGNDTGWISGNTTGWSAGNSSGYTSGWNAGNATGYSTGWIDGNLTGWIQGNATGYTLGWTTGNATGYTAGYVAALLVGSSEGSGGTPTGGGAQLPAPSSPMQITVTDWLNNPIKNITVTVFDFYQNKTIGSQQTDANGTATIKAPYTTLKIEALNVSQIVTHTQKLYTQNFTININLLILIAQFLSTPILRIPLYIYIVVATIIIAIAYFFFIQKVD